MSYLMLPVIAASFFASLLVTILAWRGGVLDFPEHRSLHARPTPRSGGLGILAGVGAGFLCLPAAGIAPGPAAVALGFGCGLGALGFADDLIGLGSRFKFAAMALACLGAAWLIGPVARLALTSELGVDLPFALGVLGSGLFLFTVINAVNFMDGSDGMLAAVMIPASIGLALAGLVAGVAVSAMMGVCLAAALGGFLIFNYPPARVFAGDAGSLAVGALYGGGALAMAGKGFPGSLWLAPLFVLPFLADVLLTLARRLRHRRLSLNAHSEHAFQRLIKSGVSHAQIGGLYAGLTSACVLGGLVAAQGPDWAPSAAFCGAVCLLTLAYVVAGRWARRRGVEA